MELQILNGTNYVGMNGTNAVGMNGTNAVGMNGTNEVVLMNGTNDVLVMNGLSFATYEDVPMDGAEEFGEDVQNLYALAYLYGDPTAMNGIKDWWKKRKAKKAGRQADKAANKAEKKARRSARRARQAAGGGFFQKAAGFLENMGIAQKLSAEKEQAMDELGIEPDPEILDQRSALMANDGYTPEDVGGSSGGGLSGWWNSLSTPAKIGVGVGGAALVGGTVYAIYKASKKGKRK